jgi:hypothetical protein
MRCPQCNQRNSVAAKKCSECDFEFPKRPVAAQVKLVVGFAACFLFLWGVALAVVPRLNDPTVALEGTAKTLANGTTNKAEEKEQLDKFDHAIQFYLKQSQGLSTQELTRKLQSVLPGTVFEVNVFNLPRGIKLVEIDEGMHILDYLLFKNANESKLIAVQGLDVFDTGTIISDASGPALVLVGHSAGTSGHHPQIKVFAMPAGELKDDSEKAVPKFDGDGKANMALNGKDIVANISLLSLAQRDNLFDAKSIGTSPVPDETLRYTLVWKDGKYTLKTEPGSGQLAALCKVAKWAMKKTEVPAYNALLNDDAKRAVEAMSPEGTADGAFVLSKNGVEQVKKGPSKFTYVLSSPAKNVVVQISRTRDGNAWQVVGLDVKEGSVNLASATPTTEPLKTDSDAAQASEPSVEAAPKMTTEPTPAPITEVTPKTTTEETTKPEKSAEETTTTETESKKPQETVEEAPTLANPLTSTVLGKVKLRNGPSTDFKSVAEIDPSTPLEVVGKKDSWYKVKAGDKEGYIYGGLLDYKKPDAFTTATIKKDKPVKDQSNKPLGTAKTGDHIVVLGGLQNNKYKVQLSNGKVGFVDKDALDVKVDAPQLVP